MCRDRYGGVGTGDLGPRGGGVQAGMGRTEGANGRGPESQGGRKKGAVSQRRDHGGRQRPRRKGVGTGLFFFSGTRVPGAAAPGMAVTGWGPGRQHGREEGATRGSRRPRPHLL